MLSFVGFSLSSVLLGILVGFSVGFPGVLRTMPKALSLFRLARDVRGLLLGMTGTVLLSTAGAASVVFVTVALTYK